MTTTPAPSIRAPARSVIADLLARERPGQPGRKSLPLLAGCLNPRPDRQYALVEPLEPGGPQKATASTRPHDRVRVRTAAELPGFLATRGLVKR